jgi:hypothetical protein
MNLLNPLGLAGLAALAPIVALYFLKLKRRKQTVSSTWLWSRSIRDIRVNAPFQRLRTSLLLLLQVLLVALAAFALAEPVGRSTAPEEKRWALLIDRSASMRMTDVKPSRLDAARAAAKEILAACGPKDEVMVVAFSDRAQVLTPFTSDRRALEAALDAVKPSDTPTRAQEAYRIAASALAPYRNRAVVILSDGRFEALQGVEEGLELRYVPIGSAQARNVAITAVEARRPARTDDPWTVFAQLDAFGPGKVDVPVECWVNGALKGVKKAVLEAGGSTALLFEFTKPEPEVVEVRLTAPDDLASDDRAWVVVTPGRARLLRTGPNNYFLDQAVGRLPDVEAFRADAFAAGAASEYDVVVMDGGAPASLPEGRFLVFGAPPAWEGLKSEGTIQQPPIVDWDRRHPVARQIAFGGLYLKSAPKLTLPPFASPIVEGPEGAPLIFAYEKGRTRAVVAAFTLLESDWPLRLSFPLFLSNALEWLRDEGRARPRPGEALRLRLPEGAQVLMVTGPHGRSETIRGEAGREAIYGDTEQAGLYLVKRPGGVDRIAVNLCEPQESRTEVARELATVAGRALAASALPPVTRPWWRWLASGALVLLMVEWFVYHRRIEL